MKTLTRNGILFDLVDPQAADVDWDATAWSCAHTNRWNGQTEQPISLAAHQLMVGESAPIALSLPENFAELLKPGQTLQWLMDVAALAGHTHDCAETVTGDMTTPMRRSVIERMYKSLVSVSPDGFGLSHERAKGICDRLLAEFEATHIAEVFNVASGLAAAAQQLHPEILSAVLKAVRDADAAALVKDYKSFSPGARARNPHLFDHVQLSAALRETTQDTSWTDSGLRPTLLAASWLTRLRTLMARVKGYTPTPTETT